MPGSHPLPSKEWMGIHFTAGPRSEDDLAAHLQLSVQVCLATADLSEVGWVVDIAARLAKDRMVQEVE